MGRRLVFFSALIALACAAPGCGVMFGYGGLQRVNVVTNPEGARLTVNGMPADERSPAELRLHPKQDHHIVARTDDGMTGGTHVTKRIRTNIVILDGVFTLGIGLLVDYLTGAIYQFQPSVAINLGRAPERSTPTAASGGPTTTATTNVLGPDAAPCHVCSEPRGDAATCPHCGMD